jgi:crotonobetainyl-CoA:carnitine CoA-transferase CaiB-like acyl-CoA transferase
VLDLTSVVMGPFATQILGDDGADVVTVEDRSGDTNRSMGSGPIPALSGVSLNLMRNKRGIGLDLKDPAGRDAFLRIAATSDIVVTNLRPGPLGRLGLTYEDVRTVRPNVIFCQAHGYPSDSADADAPAYDDIIQSASAVGDLFVQQGREPALIPTLVADKVAGLTIVTAVLAALHHRAQTGEGQFIEIPMIDVMRSFVLAEHGSGAIPEPPTGPPGYPRILTPERRPQRTADGWISVLPYAARHYRSLFAEGGREDLLDDPRIATREARIANSDGLYRVVADILATRPTAEWLSFCAASGIPATRSATIADLVDDLPLAAHPHAGTYRQIPPPVRFSTTPASIDRHAPLVGEHGREVLSEVGFSDADLDELERSGVLFEGATGRDVAPDTPPNER